MSEPMNLIFEVLQDGQLVRTERFQQDVIKIGSHNRSHLYLEDPQVSRVHAYVEVAGNEVQLIDLGSGRGTFVNGEKITKRALQHQDQITVGNTTLVFLTRDERALAAEKAAVEKAKREALVQDEILYARRYLSRPATTDGSVEIAMMFNDHVMAERLYKPPKDVTVGAAPACDFPLEHAATGESFVLIRAQGGEPVLCFTSAMSGDLYVGNQRYTLAEATAAGVARSEGNQFVVPLTAETRARIQIGQVIFFAHRSNQPVLITPLAFAIGPMLLFMVVSAALHFGFLGVINFWPVGVGGLGSDRFGMDDRFVQILIQDAQPEEPPVEEQPSEEDDDQAAADEGEAAAGDEGRAGDETETEEDGRMAIEGNADPNEAPELARAQALEEVQNRGALQVLNNAGPTSLFGDTASGYDAVGAFGSVTGDEIGASYGTGGLGRYGGGLGGGGRNMGGGFGSGPIAVRGRSAGQDGQLGRDQLAVRDREARTPTVQVGNAEIRGQLDREIIQRVVREHRREIRACYEAELQRNPNLEGRVSIEWVISPDGAVASSRIENTTLNSSAVEQCVAQRILRWRFPEPRGGGIVRVTYPFIFSPGG